MLSCKCYCVQCHCHYLSLLLFVNVVYVPVIVYKVTAMDNHHYANITVCDS